MATARLLSRSSRQLQSNSRQIRKLCLQLLTALSSNQSARSTRWQASRHSSTSITARRNNRTWGQDLRRGSASSCLTLGHTCGTNSSFRILHVVIWPFLMRVISQGATLLLITSQTKLSAYSPWNIPGVFSKYTTLSMRAALA